MRWPSAASKIVILMEPPPKKHLTFTFIRYEHERMLRFRELYRRKLRLMGKIGLWGVGVMSVLGSIYPVMMWFEYDINIAKPRMNEYLSNRLK